MNDYLKEINIKLYLYQAVEDHIVMRRRGSHVFYTIDSQMAVWLSGLRDDHPLPIERFLVLIYVRD
jgi:hypothetical protein